MNQRGQQDRKIRVLFVDDEKDVREALRMMMEVLGYEVEEAVDGLDALQKLEKGSYDLLLTDLSMPVMRGDELAATVRETHPDLPIMMLTAFSGCTVQPHVDLVMPKPPPSLQGFHQGLRTALEIGSRVQTFDAH
jgi:CheY-like chemotaxis protein